MTQKGPEASKEEEEWEKMKFLVFQNSELDQFRHTSERKAPMVYNTENKNTKMFKIFAVGHLLQCCQIFPSNATTCSPELRGLPSGGGVV
jgi:hypothetical protein